MKIQLSDHFTYKKLFRFTLPSVVMMIFTSIYGVVDGFFVTVGKPQLGLTVTIISGVSNMVLDALLVAVFDFGLSGAAAATAISQYRRNCAGNIFSVSEFLSSSADKDKILRQVAACRLYKRLVGAYVQHIHVAYRHAL